MQRGVIIRRQTAEDTQQNIIEYEEQSPIDDEETVENESSVSTETTRKGLKKLFLPHKLKTMTYNLQC